MMFSPLFPVVLTGGFCSPVFNPTLGNSGTATAVGFESTRSMIPLSAMSMGSLLGPVTKVQVTFQAGGGGPLLIRKAFIGHQHGSIAYEYKDDIAAQLFFEGEAEGITIPSGEEATAEAEFAWDKTTNLIIGLDLDEGLNSNAYATVTGCRLWRTTDWYAADPASHPPICFAKSNNLNADGIGVGGGTYRSRITQASLSLAGFSGPGDTAIIKVRGANTGVGLQINRLFIGHADVSGHAYADTPVQAFFPGPSASVALGNGVAAEATAAFAYDGVSDIIIAADFTNVANNGHRRNSSISGETTWFKAGTGAGEADQTNPSGYGTGTASYGWIEQIQFYPRACPKPAITFENPAGYCLIKRIVADGC